MFPSEHEPRHRDVRRLPVERAVAVSRPLYAQVDRHPVHHRAHESTEDHFLRRGAVKEGRGAYMRVGLKKGQIRILSPLKYDNLTYIAVEYFSPGLTRKYI